MLLRDALAQLPRDDLAKLSERDLTALTWRMEWEAKAHLHQRMPAGDWWTIWMMLAGRGAGKTRGAAEEIGWYAWRHPGERILVTAPTSEDVRTVCFEGESGLLAAIPRALIKSYTMKPSEIILHNGAMLHGIPASEPDRLRGPQWHACWAEELASWQYDREAFDMIMFALRLGQRPWMIVTTTPKPKALIRDLIKRESKDVTVVRASTYANMKHLAPTFRDQLLRYEGTQLGRQEIHAEVLDPEEQGIVKRSQIRMWPASKPLPWFEYIVMSLDGALTEETRDKTTGDPDYSACGVWGLFQYERRANAMLIDAWQARLGFPDLMTRLRDEMKSEYGQMEVPILRPLIGPAMVALETKKIDLLIVEDIGVGRSARQQLAAQGIFAFAYNPGRAKKLDRLHAVSHLFAGGASGGLGVVWMTEGRRPDPKAPGQYIHTGDFSSWATPVIDQLCTFSGEGSIPHDDHVDQTTQALRVLSDRNMLDTIRQKTPAELERDLERKAGAPRDVPQNPYAA